MILPIWIIAHCISRLSHLQYMKMHYGMTYYTISLILNILGLLVGILLIFRPMITILSMGVLVGGFMIIEGVELILVGLDLSLIHILISNMAAGNISIQLGLRGKCTDVVTACASGTHSIGDAFRAIQYGDAEIMLAGGTESCICRCV